MIVSRDEVLQLLRKWHSDDTPVSLLMRAPGLVASLAGFIATVDETSFSISHLTEHAQVLGEFSVTFSGVTVWDYKDMREASEHAQQLLDGHVASAIQFQIGGMEFAVYELVESEAR